MARSGGLSEQGQPALGGPGYDVVTRALEAIRRHHMVEPGAAVVVAVSGGPDSTCLLDVLARTRPQLDLQLVVAHVDHGLSERSPAVAARVAAVAAAAGYDVHVGRAPDLAGPNLQARARRFRYGFLEAVASRVAASAIATGHTLDDRVETTIARLVHGAGTGGVAGIPPADGLRIRPLIDVRRSETRSYCEARSLEFFDDPANAHDRFERAAIRAEVVPAVERRFGAGAVRAIAASSERLREDADALDTIAARLYRDLAAARPDGVDLERAALAEAPRALRRRLLELAVGRVRDRSGGIEAALDALERAPSSPPKRFAVAGGIEIAVAPEAVEVRRRGDE